MRKFAGLFALIMSTAVLLAQQSAPAPAPAGTTPAAATAPTAGTAPAAGTKTRAKAPAKKAASVQSVPAGAPTREEVLKLFDLLQIDKTMDFAIKTAREQSREMAEQMIQERAPEATLEQKKQLTAMIDDVMNESLGPAAIQQMLEATVPIYQRHLSKADLKAMIDFYTSPVGKKILREQPAMVEESMQAASGIQQRIARTMFQKIDQRMEEIVHSEKEKQP